MIAVVSDWHPDLPFCALIVVLMILSFIPEMIEGYRKYRIGRQLARARLPTSRAPVTSLTGNGRNGGERV
jgi:hypothetical protein